mmetsp:Transcript_6850/g.24361  ORF Transcript_6850/g.24361 Transcript_6850/m.24361 type:complete len:204 (-) Transcript_6850:1158-1769(-)
MHARARLGQRDTDRNAVRVHEGGRRRRQHQRRRRRVHEPSCRRARRRDVAGDIRRTSVRGDRAVGAAVSARERQPALIVEDAGRPARSAAAHNGGIERGAHLRGKLHAQRRRVDGTLSGHCGGNRRLGWHRVQHDRHRCRRLVHEPGRVRRHARHLVLAVGGGAGEGDGEVLLLPAERDGDVAGDNADTAGRVERERRRRLGR